MKMAVFWSLLFLSLLIVTGYVCRKVKNYWVLALSFCLSAAVPVLWVIRDCARSPVSEACVWGQSLLVFSLPLAVLVGGPLIYLLFTGLIVGFNKFRRRT